MLIIPQEKPSVLAAATWGIATESKKVGGLKDYYKEAAKFGGGINARSEKLLIIFCTNNLSIQNVVSYQFPLFLNLTIIKELSFHLYLNQRIKAFNLL
ncbi:hypothetical protein [Psychroflexus curvus]|uniref:hypothetical protein n=1 Tax=Psychroflexus curvus TaxID=2873595 RepID=UPI002AFEFE85|nr:hypothetical protein [Psychroflexus curvus]